MSTSANVIDAAANRAKQQLVDRFFERPTEFFTEADIAAYLSHRLHVELDCVGLRRSLVHLEYPTPFRCDMSTRTFELKSESDLTENNRRYRRGFFDVCVLNPSFLDEHADNYSIVKGQNWAKFHEALASRGAGSEPVALVAFELMFNRDPFWSDPHTERGAQTMRKFACEVELDSNKLLAALEPRDTGFRFARRGEVLVFDNSLTAEAAFLLRDLVPSHAQVFSTYVGRTGSREPALTPMRTWADLDSVPRRPVATLTRDMIPDSPGVYAWYRNGERWYVGKAAVLRNRIWKNHLGKGSSLSGSALRRNVAEHLQLGRAADLKNGVSKLLPEQRARVLTWLGECEIAWLTCDTPAQAVDLETALKLEFKPLLTKV